MVKFSFTVFNIEIYLEPFRLCKVFSDLEVDESLKPESAKYLSTLLTTFATTVKSRAVAWFGYSLIQKNGYTFSSVYNLASM